METTSVYLSVTLYHPLKGLSDFYENSARNVFTASLQASITSANTD
jgi:hypothetical protein